MYSRVYVRDGSWGRFVRGGERERLHPLPSPPSSPARVPPFSSSFVRENDVKKRDFNFVIEIALFPARVGARARNRGGCVLCARGAR